MADRRLTEVICQDWEYAGNNKSVKICTVCEKEEGLDLQSFESWVVIVPSYSTTPVSSRRARCNKKSMLTQSERTTKGALSCRGGAGKTGMMASNGLKAKEKRESRWTASINLIAPINNHLSHSETENHVPALHHSSFRRYRLLRVDRFLRRHFAPTSVPTAEIYRFTGSLADRLPQRTQNQWHHVSLHFGMLTCTWVERFAACVVGATCSCHRHRIYSRYQKQYLTAAPPCKSTVPEPIVSNVTINDLFPFSTLTATFSPDTSTHVYLHSPLVPLNIKHKRLVFQHAHELTSIEAGGKE